MGGGVVARQVHVYILWLLSWSMLHTTSSTTFDRNPNPRRETNPWTPDCPLGKLGHTRLRQLLSWLYVRWLEMADADADGKEYTIKLSRLYFFLMLIFVFVITSSLLLYLFLSRLTLQKLCQHTAPYVLCQRLKDLYLELAVVTPLHHICTTNFSKVWRCMVGA